MDHIEFCKALRAINEQTNLVPVVLALQGTVQDLVDQLKKTSPQLTEQLDEIDLMIEGQSEFVEGMCYDFIDNFTGHGCVANELRRQALIMSYLEKDNDKSNQQTKLEELINQFTFSFHDDVNEVKSIVELLNITFDKYIDDIEVFDLSTIDTESYCFADVSTGFYYCDPAERTHDKEKIVLVVKTKPTATIPSAVYMKTTEEVVCRFFHPYEDIHVSPQDNLIFPGLFGEIKKAIKVVEQIAKKAIHDFDPKAEINKIIAQAKDLYVHEKLLDEQLETTVGMFIRQDNNNSRIDVIADEHLKTGKKQTLNLTLLLSHNTKLHSTSCEPFFFIPSLQQQKDIKDIEQGVLRELLRKMRSNINILKLAVSERIMELNTINPQRDLQ